MKTAVKKLLEFWPIILVGISAIVFVMTLQSRVASMETAVTMMREQVAKTCEKLDGMAKDMADMRVDMASVKAALPSRPLVSAQLADGGTR